MEQGPEPWDCPSFLADLEAFVEGGRELSRRFAADAVLLARMAVLVPRADGDTRGATAWTSFLGEVAVARRTSAQLAASTVAEACLLVRLMPTTLRLLHDGRLPVPRARALLEAASLCPDEVVRQLDEQLAARAADLVPARIRAEVDRVVLQHDVDLAARRAATAGAGRGTRRTPLPDGQAEYGLRGPATVLAQVERALDADARVWRAALRGTGDTRGVDQLRFDLAAHRLLGHHAPVGTPVTADPARDTTLRSCGASSDRASDQAADQVATSPADQLGVLVGGQTGDRPEDLPVPLPDPTLPSWWTDRRFSRPVRLDVQVPVSTALGLSDEPGWLAGYGWVCAPQVRQLLPVAELRQWCVAADGESAGSLVDLAPRPVRPASVREAHDVLAGMATDPFPVTDKTWRAKPVHDPSPALVEFVRLRDGHCDSPVAASPPSSDEAGGRTDLDHDLPYPHDPPTAGARPRQPQGGAADGPAGVRARWRDRVRRHRAGALARRGWTLRTAGCARPAGPEPRPQDAGPTAAWNLRSRSRRAHGLKHRGWTPLRHAGGTTWLTPAGQLVEVPHTSHPVGVARRPLPDPLQLHAREAELLSCPALPDWLEVAPPRGASLAAGAGRAVAGSVDDGDPGSDW